MTINNKLANDETALDLEAQDLAIFKTGEVVGDTGLQEVEVKPGTMIPLISDTAKMRLNMLNVTLSFNLESYFNSLVIYRVQQIRGELRNNMNDIAIPSFFYPVLASLGKFTDPLRGLSIMPITEDEPMTIEELRAASFELRSKGIKHSQGLPRKTTLASDELYRIEESNGKLKAAGSEPSNLTILVRTAVQIEFLKDIFGAARTRYIAVDDSRPAWESVILRIMV